jgi:hypothetical protein
MAQRPDSSAPAFLMEKVRLLEPVPGSTRMGSPGKSNDGSLIPRKRALAESWVLEVRWLMTAPTSIEAIAEDAARRVAVMTAGLP